MINTSLYQPWKKACHENDIGDDEDFWLDGLVDMIFNTIISVFHIKSFLCEGIIILREAMV